MEIMSRLARIVETEKENPVATSLSVSCSRHRHMNESLELAQTSHETYDINTPDDLVCKVYPKDAVDTPVGIVISKGGKDSHSKIVHRISGEYSHQSSTRAKAMIIPCAQQAETEEGELRYEDTGVVKCCPWAPRLVAIRANKDVLCRIVCR